MNAAGGGPLSAGAGLFFLEIDGTRVGPYSVDQIQELVAQGKITPATRAIPVGPPGSVLQAIPLSALFNLAPVAPAEPPGHFPPERPQTMPEASGHVESGQGDPSRQLFEALQAVRERKGDVTNSGILAPSGYQSPAAANPTPDPEPSEAPPTPAAVRKRAYARLSRSGRVPDQIWLLGTLATVLALSGFGLYHLVKKGKPPAKTEAAQKNEPPPRPHPPTPPPRLATPPSRLGSLPAARPVARPVLARPTPPPRPAAPEVREEPPEERPDVSSPAADDDPRNDALQRERELRRRIMRGRRFTPRKDIRGDQVPDGATDDSGDSVGADQDSAAPAGNEEPADGSPAPSDDEGEVNPHAIE